VSGSKEAERAKVQKSEDATLQDLVAEALHEPVQQIQGADCAASVGTKAASILTFDLDAIFRFRG
jgi:hypothetical protein